jgi:hypothetical protein
MDRVLNIPFLGIHIYLFASPCHSLADPLRNNIGDLISTHTLPTANRFYGCEPGLMEGMTTSILLDIEELCDQYHNKVGF